MKQQENKKRKTKEKVRTSTIPCIAFGILQAYSRLSGAASRLGQQRSTE